MLKSPSNSYSQFAVKAIFENSVTGYTTLLRDFILHLCLLVH